MRLYLLRAALLPVLFCCAAAMAQTVIIGESNGSRHEGCHFLWYDSGGDSGNIARNYEGYGITFVSPDSHIRLEFTSFDIGGTMTVYDGAGPWVDPANSRLIGRFHTSTLDATTGNIPPVIFSSGNTLYIEYSGFYSDMEHSGWAAEVTCVSEMLTVPAGSACPQILIGDSTGTAQRVIEHRCGQPILLTTDIIAFGRHTNDYTVTQIPYAPPFPFNEGTPVTADDDDKWIPRDNPGVDLPFTFSFFGQNYNRVYPGTNGLISFTRPYGPNVPNGGLWYCAWESTVCPTRSTVTLPYLQQDWMADIETWGTVAILRHPYLYPNSIYGVMEDVDCRCFINNGSVRYGIMGEYPCRTFVFNYDNVGLYQRPGETFWGDTVPRCFEDSSKYNSYQMVLYEGTNIIDIYIRHRANNPNHNNGNGVVGIQNSTSSQMIIAPGRDLNVLWTADLEAWRFTPVTPPDEEAVVEWYENSLDSPVLSTDTEIEVNPEVITDYIVKYRFTNSYDSVFILYDTITVRVTIPTENTIAHTA